MRRSTAVICALGAAMWCGGWAVGEETASGGKHRTDWFHDAKWGVFTHYLTSENASVEEWNAMVDAFDVRGLAEQLASIEAKYYFITLGQNSGHYCSPNAAYDRHTGIRPSKCSRRDLVSDLYEVLQPKGIRLMVYLPSGAPDRDPAAMKALGWKTGRYPFYAGKRPEKVERDASLAGFQRKWEDVVREWSQRWGNKVCGWWFDGCYFPFEMYLFEDEPNFGSLARAARAGNAGSLVAFNPGVMSQGHWSTAPNREVITETKEEDYTAGEVSDCMVQCHGRWVDQAQFHILSYLGERWGGGKLRFSNEFVTEYVREINENGGVVTWDVAIQRSGLIQQEYVDQLRALRDGLARPRKMTPEGNLASRGPAKLLDISGAKTLWVNGAKRYARCGVDGDPATWAQAGGEWPWTYEVDLQEVHAVGRVVVTFAKDCYATEYTILVSPSGKGDWKAVAHQTGCKGGVMTHAFEPVSARFVRVQGQRPDGENQEGNQMGVAELEVYEAKGSSGS